MLRLPTWSYDRYAAALCKEGSHLIRITNLKHVYNANTDTPVVALDGVNLEFRPGEFVVIFGHNGCGKSTLAKHLNGLLLPTEGDVEVEGLNTKNKEHLWEIRQNVGMVFQNPDNQLVATVVEDDVSFGAENIGVEPGEIQRRVDEAMERMGISDLKRKAPHMLSGGQKQRVAIAGVLVMRSHFVVLDEPTSLLDPDGREEVIKAALHLAREEGLGVIVITHFMHEAVAADRVIVMEGGKVALDGTPRQVFANTADMRKLRLDVPAATQVTAELRRLGAAIRPDILTVEELLAELCPSS